VADPSGADQVILQNFANSGGDAAYGTVSGNSLIVDNQEIGDGWTVGGNATFISSNRLNFTYFLTIGGNQESCTATYSK